MNRMTAKLTSTEDAMEIIHSSSGCCLFHLKDLRADFFDLQNKLAGEVFQKFVNYKCKAAIIVPADHGLGERVTELIRDHKHHAFVRFFDSEACARQWLSAS